MREVVEANKANIPANGLNSGSTDAGSADVSVRRDADALGGGVGTPEHGEGGRGDQRGGELGSDTHDDGDVVSDGAATGPSAGSDGGEGRQGGAWGRLAGIFR